MNIYRGRSHTEVYLASILYDSIEDQDFSSIIKILVDKKADSNIILPGKGISCFHLAIGNDSSKFAMEVTSLIIQNGGDPNVVSDEGLTPVHIAAAWGRVDILRLLLYCGGDPQITDNCYKTALQYALDENREEAATLIKDFITYQRLSTYDNFSPRKKSCTIALDKIILNNGVMIGEYEVNDTNTDLNLEKENNETPIPRIDLLALPQTDTQEYVLNWCNNQELACSQTDFAENYLAELDCSDNDGSIASKKNIDLSQSSSVKSKYSSEILSNPNSHLPAPLSCKNTRKFNNVTLRNRTRYLKNYVSKDICKYKESSRESGILTLPFSSEEDQGYSDNDFEQQLYKYDNNRIIDDFQKINIKENNDTSSDYCTCTDGSETTNILDKTIYGISTNKNGNIVKCSDHENQDLSFVSLSEVYKYTDPDEGVVLYEKRIIVTPTNSIQSETNSTNNSQSSLPKSFDYDTDTLRKELTNQGFDPGPITKTTKRVYLRKLYQLKNRQEVSCPSRNTNEKVYSPELQRTLKDIIGHQTVFQHQHLEELVKHQFTNPDPSRKWRGGTAKSSFTYLLLDPRITQNLPHRCDQLQKTEIWTTFLSAIFYVGKGKRSRPFQHLYEAVRSHNKAESNATNKKVDRILDIWKDNHGVICLHVFQNVIPVEAYTREAAMISALNLENITNIKGGEFYGISATWNQKQKKLLGVYLLYKAMKIFLNEGERQIFPNDIE